MIVKTSGRLYFAAFYFTVISLMVKSDQKQVRSIPGAFFLVRRIPVIN